MLITFTSNFKAMRIRLALLIYFFAATSALWAQIAKPQSVRSGGGSNAQMHRPSRSPSFKPSNSHSSSNHVQAASVNSPSMNANRSGHQGQIKPVQSTRADQRAAATVRPPQHTGSGDIVSIRPSAPAFQPSTRQCSHSNINHFRCLKRFSPRAHQVALSHFSTYGSGWVG
jgi:hypothetical protein